jgi:hypothetical protein
MRTRRCAWPRCAAGCTAIGLNRCCGVQLRLAAARRTPMRGGRRLCGRSGSATAPTRCRSLSRWQGANSPSLGALRCSRGEPSLGADLARVTPVLGPMAAWTVWQGSATATIAAMGTVGVCWLLLVCLLSHAPTENLGYLRCTVSRSGLSHRCFEVPLRRCYE